MRTLIVVAVHFSLKMSKYGVPEHISIVKAYYLSNSSPIVAQRTFAAEYKLKTTGSSVITIKNVIEKFERTGSVAAIFAEFCSSSTPRHAIDGKHIEHVIN
ncbi:hypothetical protein AVEN_190616-1 [Araneus ventricosus]|uniref:DUF4817 domain-containing protein n=1 Tax=Araneus ventricosus TaxID=182803 RepID=A0A4Y2CE14_ARAVE|nr:hypothetical protein AVEN_190616-1 [Araneus ventricosus]